MEPMSTETLMAELQQKLEIANLTELKKKEETNARYKLADTFRHWLRENIPCEIVPLEVEWLKWFDGNAIQFSIEESSIEFNLYCDMKIHSSLDRDTLYRLLGCVLNDYTRGAASAGGSSYRILYSNSYVLLSRLESVKYSNITFVLSDDDINEDFAKVCACIVIKFLENVKKLK